MSSRHVRKWVIAAPIIGLVMVGCGSSNTVFTGVGGGGNGGTTPTGNAGSGQGGSGGSSAGTGSGGEGTGGSSTNEGGTGGTSSNGTGGTSSNAGTGGTTGELGYEPVGVGDPWFFSSESELAAFTFDAQGATGSAVWNSAGEVHIPLSFAQTGDKAFIHFTAPFDATTSTHNPMDLTHRVLKARVRIASGATATGGVEPYSQSVGWTWGAGTWNSFSDLGSWTDVEYDFDNASDPSAILRFGLQLYGTGAGSAEVIIDDIRLEPKPEEPQPDGGAGEPDAGGAGTGGSGGEEPPPHDAGAGEPDGGSAGTGGTGSEPDAGGAGTGGTDGSGGSGGLGYEPVGIGDPWFFDTAPEMTAFTFGAGYMSAATGSQSWSDGEVHMNATCANAGDTWQMQFTTAWNGTTNTQDLTGRVLKSRVRIGAGATIAGGGVQLFAQSGGWQWMNSGWNDISGLGSTSEVTFALSEIQAPNNVQRFGVQVYCGSAGNVELIVDDMRLEPAN